MCLNPALSHTSYTFPTCHSGKEDCIMAVLIKARNSLHNLHQFLGGHSTVFFFFLMKYVNTIHWK